MRTSLVLFLMLFSVVSYAEDGPLTESYVNWFYTNCWRQLKTTPPNLENPSPEQISKELNRSFHYAYRDADDQEPRVGKLLVKYPQWNWPKDRTAGSVKQSGGKFLLVLHREDATLLRGFLLRINGDWHLMAMDIQGGLTKLNSVTSPPNTRR